MKVVVVFSGGIDSVCIAARLAREHDIYGITFSYGQRADRETQEARRFARILQMKEHRTVDIGFMRELYGTSNVLTDPETDIPASFDYSIVVPVRNAIFLSIATAWAYSLGARMVAYGAHTGDAGYPDCRPAFATALAAALNTGEEDGIRDGIRQPIRIWSPYIEGMSKSELLQGGMKDVGEDLFSAWSCYTGDDAHCGLCESCRNRRAAFTQAGIADHTTYTQ